MNCNQVLLLKLQDLIPQQSTQIFSGNKNQDNQEDHQEIFVVVKGNIDMTIQRLLDNHDRLRNLVALDRLAAAVTSSVSRELMFDLHMRSYQMTTSPPANSCCPARVIGALYRR